MPKIDTVVNQAINQAIKQTIKQAIKPTSKRHSKTRTRSFGSNTRHHLKQFLIIVLFVLVRSLLKKQPYSHTFNDDFDNIANNAFNVLTITSILEIIEKIVGRENRDKILLAYTIFSIGSDIQQLI